MRRKKSSKKSLISNFFIFLLSVVLFTLFVFLFSSYFNITKINIITRSKKNLIGVELLKNKNCLLITPDQIKKIILERNPQIEVINIEKELPNELTIYYELLQPFVEIKANNGYLVLSRKGKIIQKNKKESKEKLPKIQYYQQFDYLSFNIGDVIDTKDIQYSLSFASKIKDSELSFTSIDIASPNMIRLSLDDSVVYLTTEKDINTQNNQLLKIIEQFKIEGKKFKILDLRFDKPVIKLN